MKMRVLLMLSLLAAIGSLSALSANGQKEPTVALGSRRPLVAVWRGYDGRFSSEAPYLRIAIWEDGRVLFATDPKKWSHSLQQGKISAQRVAEMKKRIAETGVFNLKGTCYLVPDASEDCIMVDFGARKQMLYWDEVESASYGINSDPTPPHLKFKACWKAVNQLALDSRPSDAKPIKGRFRRVPQS